MVPDAFHGWSMLADSGGELNRLFRRLATAVEGLAGIWAQSWRDYQLARSFPAYRRALPAKVQPALGTLESALRLASGLGDSVVASCIAPPSGS